MATIEYAQPMPNTATRAERYAAGKALRSQCLRDSHAEWAPAADRPDPISMLEESNRTRVPHLVPIRYGRMSLSPFAFLRGSAVVMARDLAHTTVSGIQVQICGDAHLSNFGFFATPERNLVFDVNDFDETIAGPWEWDLKRLAASIVVAGRQKGFSSQQNKQAVLECIKEYHTLMHNMASMQSLPIWYMHTSIVELMEMVNAKEQIRLHKEEKKASSSTNLKVFPKLTELVNGQYRIKDQPPLIVHYDNLGDDKKTEEFGATKVKEFFEAYQKTLQLDRQTLLSKYHFVDIAQKVVGVGSVGTRASVILLMAGGDGDDPLFLQIKEAQASVLEPYAGSSPFQNHGERVVRGQRLMQEASDIFLGWTRTDSTDYYVRQLRDMKLSEDIDTMTEREFDIYAQRCAMALARAHARSGDPAQISGYMGRSDVFEQAISTFAEAYADQTQRDHAALLAAIKSGRIHAVVDV
jgi:uncharacterized protein (DUF2252 family)